MGDGFIPGFPIAFRDVTILTAFYRTEPAAVAAALPAPLRPTTDTVAVQLYRMPDVEALGSLSECNVMIGARLDRPEGALDGGFTVAHLITSDTGLAHGREVHGQPKQLARVSLETREDLVVGVVERNGIDVITVTSPYKCSRADPTDMQRHFDVTLNLNHKRIPHIDGTMAVDEITARRLADVTVHGCWTGAATVELRPNARVPVWQLPVLEPLEAFLWQADFTLVAGERLHNYLDAGR
jgi:acetoacetate decarboxylase